MSRQGRFRGWSQSGGFVCAFVLATVMGVADAAFFALADPVYVRFGMPQGPIDAAASDLDSDGQIDLIVAFAESPSAAIFFGDASEPYAHSLIVEMRLAARRVATGDFDEDGDDDVAFGSIESLGVTTVFLNHGGRSFGNAQECTSDAVDMICAAAIAAAEPNPATFEPDLDDDGLVDFWVPQFGADVSFALGAGGVRTVLSLANGLVEAVAAPDFNGDGAEDLVIVAIVDDHIEIFTARGQGQFQFDSPEMLHRTGDGVLTFARFDVGLSPAVANNDGVDDVVVNLEYVQEDSQNPGISNARRERLLLMSNAGELSPFLAQGIANAAAFADVDVDNRPDLIELDTRRGGVFVRIAAESNNAFSDVPESIGFGRADTNHFAVGDLDGDGRQDIAAVNCGSNAVRIAYQVLPGRFNLGDEILFEGQGISGSTVYDVEVGDFDGDNVDDLIVASQLPAVLPSGGVTPVYFGADNRSSTRILAGDFDDDGALDFLRLLSSSVEFYFGDGTGGVAAMRSFDIGFEVDSGPPKLIEFDPTIPGPELKLRREIISLAGFGPATTDLTVLAALPGSPGLLTYNDVIAGFGGEPPADVLFIGHQTGLRAARLAGDHCNQSTVRSTLPALSRWMNRHSIRFTILQPH